MILTTPTHYQAFNSQGPPIKEMLLQTESCLKKLEMEPLQGERVVFYTRLYKKAEEWATQH